MKQYIMKLKETKELRIGIVFIAAFILWTILIQIIDVQPIGPNETKVGFATINGWFHRLTGNHMAIYVITDWLGLVPVFGGMVLAILGLIQLINRRHLFRVDLDILVLGVYYVVVIICYLLFEMVPMNYRPILIEGRLEASYPSSTTLLVLCVMPTLVEQARRRVENVVVRKGINLFAIFFSAFMVSGRLISGVHWLTDIIGAILFSVGVFSCYKAVVKYHKTDECSK